MRSAIVLIWLSLFWTLLCFLFYRDRELIVQASLPVWIAAAAAWIVLGSPWSIFNLLRRRRRGRKPRATKKPRRAPASSAGGARSPRPRTRASGSKTRKRPP